MTQLTDNDLQLIRMVVRDEIAPTAKVVSSLKTTLVGQEEEDNGGLCGDVKYLIKDHSALKRNFYILVAFLIGSGAITGGIWALLKLG